MWLKGWIISLASLSKAMYSGISPRSVSQCVRHVHHALFSPFKSETFAEGGRDGISHQGSQRKAFYLLLIRKCKRKSLVDIPIHGSTATQHSMFEERPRLPFGVRYRPHPGRRKRGDLLLLLKEVGTWIGFRNSASYLRRRNLPHFLLSGLGRIVIIPD